MSKVTGAGGSVWAALCACHCIRTRGKPTTDSMAAQILVSQQHYCCDVCGQDGLSDAEMRTHVLLEHIEGAASCPFCDLGDISPQEMNLHVNNFHLDHLRDVTSLDENDFVKTSTTDNVKLKTLEQTKSKSNEHGSQWTVFDDADVINKNTILDRDISPTKDKSQVTDLNSKNNNMSQTKGLKADSQANDSLIKHDSNKEEVDDNKPCAITIDVSPVKKTIEHDAMEEGEESRQSCKRAKLYLNVSGYGSDSKSLSNGLDPGSRANTHSSSSSTSSLSATGTGNSLTFRGYDCPLCSWTTVSAAEITQHVNQKHMDVIQPAQSHHSAGRSWHVC